MKDACYDRVLKVYHFFRWEKNLHPKIVEIFVVFFSQKKKFYFLVFEIPTSRPWDFLRGGYRFHLSPFLLEIASFGWANRAPRHVLEPREPKKKQKKMDAHLYHRSTSRKCKISMACRRCTTKTKTEERTGKKKMPATLGRPTFIACFPNGWN